MKTALQVRRGAVLLALTAAIGAGVAASSSRTAGYAERLLDIAARQMLAPVPYRESADAPVLRAVLLDAARDAELSFKMRLALEKYGVAARQVLEAFGTDPLLHDALRRFGESVLPVVAYFMDHDSATLRAMHGLGRLGQALKSQATSVFSGDSTETTPEPYSPVARGRHAIEQIDASGHRFLAQFSIDPAGVAHWNQTDRVLKSVEEFFAGGIRNLETRHDLGAPIGIGDALHAGADVLTAFGFVKVFKLLQASRASGKVAQQAALSSGYRSALGRRVLLAGGRVGVAAGRLGGTVAAVYLVLRHPGLLTSLFVEAGAWLNLPPWFSAAAGWWAVALALSLMLLPLLGWITVLNPVLARIARAARWLMGRNASPEKRPDT